MAAGYRSSKSSAGTPGGVEAVVDKDLAGKRLATLIGAVAFVMLTDVDDAYLHFGTDRQRLITRATVSEMERYYEEGHSPPGSMRPKVLAAIRFVRNGGKRAVIAKLDKLLEAVEGKAGTTIVSG